ncbi:MAG: type II toxin-antitoxin system RelE/ParE family toxin [Candidatus Thorarchaeota archaeon]|nr:type II toxin-antitoxin system RelE/ParE family toxin [Candidatus Thorarchaeota archaeon]
MTEKFEVRFTPRFLGMIRSLDRTTQTRILDEISILKTRPFIGKPLRGEWKGIFSLRVGNYRVLYQIRENVVYLLVVDHRRRVYRQ